MAVGSTALTLISGVLQWQLLSGAQAGNPISPEAASANDSRHLLLARIQLAALLISAILFLIWLHRAYANLREANGQKTDMTAGWAVGYWFIPFVNLWRPYQIMKELWLKTHAGLGVFTAPSSLGLWWASYLVSGVAGRAAATMSRMDESISGLLAVTFFQASSDFLLIIAGVLLMGLIKSIDRSTDAPPTSIPAAA